MSYPDQLPIGHAELDLQEHLEVALLRVGGLRLTDWRHGDLHAPHWRLYCNHQDGARIMPRGLPTVVLQARRRYLIPPWLHFSSEARNPVDHVFCHFDILGLPGALIRQRFAVPLRLQPDADAERRLLALGDAVAEGQSPTPAGVCRWKAAVHTAVAEALDLLPGEERARLLRHTRGDLPLRQALEHIHTRLGEDLGNAVLAARARVSPDHLIRLFRRHLGQTPATYVQERRLAAAARDLLRSDDSIDAIAERHGFANRFYFSRVFARRLAMPPAAWRKRHREAAGRG